MTKTIIYTRLGLTYSDWEVSIKVKDFLESKYLHTIRISNWNFIQTIQKLIEVNRLDYRNIEIIYNGHIKAKTLIFTKQGNVIEKSGTPINNSFKCLEVN